MSQIHRFPIYGQHPNGCGLATLLMLLDLPQNKPFEEFLNTAWKKLSILFGDVGYKYPEYHWAIVFQYFLLKILGYGKKDKIYEFFTQRLEFVYEDQRIVNKFDQEGYRELLIKQGKTHEAYTYLHYLEEHDYITPHLLYTNLHSMKTDIELKILAEIFNYQFEFHESEDNTGAIYFLPKEIKNPLPKSARAKWILLETAVQNPKKIVLWGKQHHWLTINSIYRKNPNDMPDPKKNTDWVLNSLFFDVNDPAPGKQMVFSMTAVTIKDRFYIFNKRSTIEYPIFNLLLDAIDQDIDEEKQRWNQFLEQKKATTASSAPTADNSKAKK